MTIQLNENGTIDIPALDKNERSIITYAESTLVDYGGLLEGQRMNIADHNALKQYAALGVLEFRRIPGSLLEGAQNRQSRSVTHMVTFTDAAWALSHALRRMRASQISVTRKMIDDYIAEQEKNQAMADEAYADAHSQPEKG